MSKPHSQLVKEHFEQKYYNYDYLIRKLIPRYSLMHRNIINYIKKNTEEPKMILDLGVGTGYTSKYIFEAFPSVKIVGVDISEKMISIAKQKLFKYIQSI